MALMGIFGKKRVTKGFFVNSYGNNQTRGIYTFHIDIDNGELLFKKHFQTPTDPVYSFNYGRFVCMTFRNRTGSATDGGVCSYASTMETLALVSRVSDEGKTYVHGCTNGDVETADKLFCTDYYNGEIMVASIKKKKLVRPIFKYKLEGHSIDPIKQTLPHPCYVDFTPDKQRLYVLALGLDKILLFDVKDDGTLILDEEHSFDVEAGSGPKKMMFNARGDRAYVLNELSSTIYVYEYHDLHFKLIQTIDTYPKDEDDVQNFAGQMKFGIDEEYIFITNKGHDSLVLMKVNDDGTLTYLDFADTSPNPCDLEVFENKWIVVCCQKGGIVESYRFTHDKGGLVIETNYSYMVNEPVCITPFINNY